MTRYLTEIWLYIRSNPKKFILQSVLALFVFWFVFGDFGLVTRISMERDHRELMKRQTEEQRKILEDRATIRQAYHQDSIEKVAREKYNFRKPGETVFIIRQ
ncbi:MAG: septum formation initiator family protein [Chlorobiaceae bacterium]|nr:septum formation initiator family protein [Chlorobiaceae bacterium]NTW73778.1 septum formation initiator family protein [Chlorobiaceae bacterium]